MMRHAVILSTALMLRQGVGFLQNSADRPGHSESCFSEYTHTAGDNLCCNAFHKLFLLVPVQYISAGYDVIGRY